MTSWLVRSQRPAPAERFGPLEWRVLEALWAGAGPASVRDLQPVFPGIAYTTLMTTMDRLHRKGVLDRDKRGRAFYYAPHVTQSEFESERAAEAVRSALERDSSALGLLLSLLVRAVGDRDRELLDELEALVRARRAEIEGRRS